MVKHINKYFVAKRKWSMGKQNIIKAFFFALPALALMFVFYVYPMFLSVKYSFSDWNGISSHYNFIGLTNFLSVLKDENFMQVFVNTLLLAALYVPVLNLFAFLLALLIFDIGRIGNLYKTVMFFPNLLSAVVVGFVWKLIYSYSNGLLNTFLNSIGLEFLAQEWLGQGSTVLPSLSATIVWFATGFYLIIYLAGLTGIPVEIYESTTIDGAGWFQKLFKVTIPMIASSITINLVISTISILQFFDLPYVLTQGGPGYMSQTIALQVYNYAFYTLQQGKGMALSLLLTLFIISISLIQLKVLKKREEVNK